MGDITKARGAGRDGSPRVLLIAGGTVVDGLGRDGRRGDVLIEDGRIVSVEATIEPPRGATVLDAGGCVVMPGLVDLHAHLRQPGREEAETVETGARAASLGGFTAVVAMPNTEPAIDSADAVRGLYDLASEVAVEVAVAGAITVGRLGEKLVSFGEMAALGVRLFTDDGRGVQHAGVMRRALEYARPLGVVLAEHCEDEELAGVGAMHEGAWSSRLGLPGQPALAEEVMLARDIDLVRLTGAPMHFLHLSTARSVELVRAARAEGLPVTAEVTPHHLSLTDAEVASFDPVFKVNPPLRTACDVAALRAGLRDGTIQAIATDHAPHTVDAKEAPWAEAPPGMLGLETALAVVYTAMHAGADAAAEAPASTLPAPGSPNSLSELVTWMSLAPARIAGLDVERTGRRSRPGGHGGPIVPGARAHLCIFDGTEQWVVDPGRSASRSRNTPWAGRRLQGRVRHTIFDGEPVVVDGEACR